MGQLVFKGVPMTGTVENFVEELWNRGGLGIDERSKGRVWMKGDFAGYTNCQIVISPIEGKNLINSVLVKFPTCYNWQCLISKYTELKEMLITKYGTPSSIVEKFNAGYIDDSQKIKEINYGRCSWYTLFNTSQGTIKLAIATHILNSAVVIIEYTNKTGVNNNKATAIEDL
jgi:hypothetical protein